MEGDFKIEDWLVQPHRNAVVSSSGEIAHLEPRVMEVLQFLASRPGKILSKDEIIQSVWRDAFVTDDALGRCIVELRRIFHDQPSEPRIIRTVPKRGYGLIASVEVPSRSEDRYQDLHLLRQSAISRVYLARDVELRRQVVLKFLAETPGDEIARKRLLHEARAAAGLDHPYICKIYDLGTLQDEPFVAMEYIEGETLKSRLAREPMALGEAIGTAIEIAEAIESAHKRGIVHRDLKPANVMLAAQGHIKVLDFGLAKRLPATSAAAADSTSGSRQGEMSGGTVPYMSPEQLRRQGEEATSDIFSFGLVLYEMVAGKHPFYRESPIDIAAGILNETPPPLGSFLPGVPVLLDHIVRKALAKDPSRRYQVTQDLRTDLESVRDELRARPRGANGVKAGEYGGKTRGIPWKVVLTAACLVAATALSVVAVRYRLPRRSADRPGLVASIPVGEGIWLVGIPPGPVARDESAFAQQRPTRTALSLSPDGRLLAFSAGDGAGSRIYLRPLDADTAHPLAGTEGGAAPFFSPDGRRVAFWVGRTLKAAGLHGSAPVSLCEAATSRVAGAHWPAGNVVLFSNRQFGIWRANPNGGRTEQITVPDPDTIHTLPYSLPGDRAMLYTRLPTRLGSRPDLMLHSFESGTEKVLIPDASDARFVPPGHLLFARSGNLMAVPFDAKRLRLTGPETVVVRGVMHSVGSWSEVHTGAAQFAVANSGLLAYVPGGTLAAARSLPMLVDRTGRESPIQVAVPVVECPRVSPDGKRIAFSTGDSVWSCDRDGRALKRLFVTDGYYPLWTRNGSGILCEHRGGTMFGNLRLFRLGDTSLPPPLSPAGAHQFAAAVSPAGESLAYVVESGSYDRQVWVMRLPDKAVSRFSMGDGVSFCPDFSPDGKLIAYTNEYQGSTYVVVEEYKPKPEDRASVRFSGREPRWSVKGRELYFRSGAALHSVEVIRQPALALGRQARLFEISQRYQLGYRVAAFDVMPDDRQFLMTARVEPPPSPATLINIVLDWRSRPRPIGGSSPAK